MICNTMAFQGSILWWARDHRSHHKFTNTSADPYNAKRGMFFAHMGWMFTRKNKDIAKNPVGVSDLEKDVLVQFQHRWYLLLAMLLCYGVPMLYGKYVYGDKILGFLVFGCLRWTMCSHATWLVNSLAHSGLEGDGTVDHWLVNLFAGGEGYHNWHHKYPSDAFGSPRTFVACLWNFTGVVVCVCAFCGLVWDMKKARGTEMRITL